LNPWLQYDHRLAGLLMVSFLLPIRLQVFIILPIMAFWTVRDALLRKEKITSSEWKAASFFALLYILYLVWLPITPKEQRSILFHFLEQKAALLLLPFVFITLRQETKKIIVQKLPVFVLATLASVIMGNVLYLLKAGGEHVAGHVAYRNYFEFATSVHPTYMGMYLCFSIAWLLLHDNWQRRLRSWVIVVVYTFFITALLALMPKAPVVALACMVFVFSMLHWKQKNDITPLSVAIIIAILISVLLIPFTSQRIAELTALVTSNPALAEENSVSMRWIIWDTDLKLLKDNWLFGLGPAGLETMLGLQYYMYSLLLQFPMGIYNTHNEYLNHWLSFGILGLIILLSVLVIQFIKAIKSCHELYLYFLIIITITFFTENVLSRQHGVLFYAFFAMLFYFHKSSVSKQLPSA
jgi:O-antigen ligase